MERLFLPQFDPQSYHTPRLDCKGDYGNSTDPETAPRILSSLKSDVEGKHVLLVDDILDTGNTMEKSFPGGAVENLPPFKPVFFWTNQTQAKRFSGNLIRILDSGEFVVDMGSTTPVNIGSSSLSAP